jgi:hypothetical protein
MSCCITHQPRSSLLNCVRSADYALDKALSLESGDVQMALRPDSTGDVVRSHPFQGIHVRCKDAYPTRIDQKSMVRWHTAIFPTQVDTGFANVPWSKEGEKDCAADHRPLQ